MDWHGPSATTSTNFLWFFGENTMVRLKVGFSTCLTSVECAISFVEGGSDRRDHQPRVAARKRNDLPVGERCASRKC